MSSAAPQSLIALEVIADMCKLAGETPRGAIIEVGVWHGGSAWYLSQLAETQKRPCALFDTFRGIPYREDFDPHRVGDFADTSADKIRELIPYAYVVEGVFPESAIEILTWPVAFAHLDCDQYKSYVDALEFLTPRMVKGGVIWCDDDTCLPGAEKAVAEFLASHSGVAKSNAHGKTTLHY